MRIPPSLLFLVFYCGTVGGQRTGTGPRDRGNPEFRPDRYDSGRWGGPTNTETDPVPKTGTGARDRMGGEGDGRDPGVSQQQLDQGPNVGNATVSNLAVNLTHALAVDQSIADGGGEEAYLGILR